MFGLDPASKAELDEFCSELSDSQAAYLRKAVVAVCMDPSGKRLEPRHSYTRPFRSPEKYVRVRKGVKVWEFKTNHHRGLFVTESFKKRDQKTGKEKLYQVLAFLPVKGARFFAVGDAPWPH